MALDDLDKAFNAQNVKMKFATVPGGGKTIDQEIVSVHLLEDTIDNPVTRRNTRGGPKDFYTHAVIEYSLTALVTKTVRDTIRAMSKQNSRSALPLHDWEVNGENLGVAADDITVPFDAEVRRFNSRAAESGDWTINWILRVKNSSLS